MPIFTAKFAAALAIAFTTAAATEVDGTLVFHGTEVKLAHGLAVYYDNEEQAQPSPELRLLFSDRPVDVAALHPPVLSGLETMVRSRNFNGLLIRFDPANPKAEVTAVVLIPPIDGQTPLHFLTFPSIDRCFPKFDQSDTLVSGATEHSSTGPPNWSFSARFETPIIECPAVTRRVDGKDAVATEPARAFLELEKALRDGDMEKWRKYATPAKCAEYESFIGQAGRDAFIREMNAQLPDTPTRSKQIKAVIFRSESASILIESEDDRRVVVLTKLDAGWKVAY